MNQNSHTPKALDIFSIARLVTPILLAILSAVIEGSEITRSIIFCAVLLTFFCVSDVSPNLSAFTPNFSTELLHLHRTLLCLHRTFRPNFLRLPDTFRGYYLPVGYFFNRHSSVVTPVQIIECGVERSRFRLILRLFSLQEIR